MAQNRLFQKQMEILQNQKQLIQLQHVVDLMGVPGTGPVPKNIVVNPAISNQLAAEEKSVGAISVGDYKMKGWTRNDEIKKQVEGPEIFLSMWPGGAVSGTAVYPESPLHPELHIEIVGDWTPTGLNYVEVFQGKEFGFRGTFDGNKKLKGSYSFNKKIGGVATGTFEYNVFSRKVLAPNTAEGVLPSGYFVDSPAVDAPHEVVPLGEVLETGFFIAEGKTENDQSHSKTTLPSMLFILKNNGNIMGKTTFLATNKHPETTARMAGHWDHQTLDFRMIFEGKIFHFRGLQVSKGLIEGVYKFGQEGSGKFTFNLKKVVYQEKDQLATPEMEKYKNPPPVKAAPAGNVYNHVISSHDPKGRQDKNAKDDEGDEMEAEMRKQKEFQDEAERLFSKLNNEEKTSEKIFTDDVESQDEAQQEAARQEDLEKLQKIQQGYAMELNDDYSTMK